LPIKVVKFFSDGEKETVFLRNLTVDVPLDDTIFLPPLKRAIKYYTHFRGIGVASFGTGIAYLEKHQKKYNHSLEAMHQHAGEIEGFIG